MTATVAHPPEGHKSYGGAANCGSNLVAGILSVSVVRKIVRRALTFNMAATEVRR